MKTLLLCFVGVLCFYEGIAQSYIYHPFVQPSRVMFSREVRDDIGANSPFIEKTWVEELRRDSIINGLNYSLLESYYVEKRESMITQGGVMSLTTSLLGQNYTLLGGIREDNKKVYYQNIDHSYGELGLDTLFQQEYLLFDFGMEVGDSILRTASFAVPSAFSLTVDTDPPINYYMHVTKVDSILLEDMTYRKQIILKGVYPIDNAVDTVCYSWVEGLGIYTANSDCAYTSVNFGVLGGFVLHRNPYVSLSPPYVIPEVKCWKENSMARLSNSVHCNTLSTYLSIIPVVKDDLEVIVAPNPMQDRAVFELNGPIEGELSLELFNLHGQRIRMLPNISNNSFVLERNNIPNGMYYYRISAGTKFVKTGMLVVN